MNIYDIAATAGFKRYLTPTGTNEWHCTTHDIARLVGSVVEASASLCEEFKSEVNSRFANAQAVQCADAIRAQLRDYLDELITTAHETTQEWKTLDSCPDKESVLFYCKTFMQVGRMEHNVTRLDGNKRDLFWGWFGADEAPPTHWMPLPAAPRHE